MFERDLTLPSPSSNLLPSPPSLPHLKVECREGERVSVVHCREGHLSRSVFGEESVVIYLGALLLGTQNSRPY